MEDPANESKTKPIPEADGTEERVKLGSELAAFGRRWGGFDLVIERDRSPAEPPTFE